ncbi:hypothetical protein [Paraburkholderia sacchari]|uniref:hypothetical protein n=1 Tax=Paraburkholderia sacchari TaxID=159450 RepID=UPI001BCF97F3|nr:hypothetical protein [Paraburkholderia sacchari]
MSQSVADVQARFLQDSSIAIRLLGQRAAQHEAILATLGAALLSASPAQVPENLHASVPQLTALRSGGRGSRWVGANASTSTAPPSHVHAGQVSLTFDGASTYWLIGDSGWAVRIHAQQLLQAGDWPASWSSATLRPRSHEFNLLRRTAADAPFGWTLHLEKHLPARPQDFVLLTTRTLRAADLPWLAMWLWNAVCALIAAAALGTWRLLDVTAERDAVRCALQTCVEQARRAAAILGRLRGVVTSAHGGKRCALDPDALMNTLLLLYRDELAREQIALVWRNDAPRERPFAEQVAIEQLKAKLSSSEVFIGLRGRF